MRISHSLPIIALACAQPGQAIAANSAGQGQQSLQSAASPSVGSEPSVPKIHIVEVVDQSGCKSLKGGLATGGAALAGGLLAKKAGLGGMGILGAGYAGELVGGKKDESSRCKQVVNIQPDVALSQN